MKYVLFSISKDIKNILINLKNKNINIDYITDNYQYDIDYKFATKTYHVYYPTKLLQENKNNIFIFISSITYYTEIANQLSEMGFIEGKHFTSCINYIQTSWEITGNLEPYYEFRVYKMAQLISSDSKSVLDVGCGNMELKKYLGPNVKYIPCDYIKRDKSTIICDLNKEPFPNIQVDTILLSGILEYIKDYNKFINEISKICYKNNSEIIISYVTLEHTSNIIERKRCSWVNHLSIEELIDLFNRNNMTLITSQRTTTKPSQTIFKFGI